MSEVLRFQMGELRPGDVVQVNLAYILVKVPFNLYAENSKMTIFYPDSPKDELAAVLTASELCYQLAIDGDDVTHLGVVRDETGKPSIGQVEGPFPYKDHALAKIDSDLHNYLVDLGAPNCMAVMAMHQQFPALTKHLSSQMYCFASALYDDHLNNHLIEDWLTNKLADEMSDEDILWFINTVETHHATKRTQRMIEGKGFVILGREGHEGNPAVFYTLGLHKTTVGRNLLYSTPKHTPEALEAFQIAAQAIREYKTVAEVNELLKPHKCSVAISNLKTLPKNAFEFASEQYPIGGVLKFTAK